MGKKLFITDLDGTLLRQDMKISEFTMQTLNALIDRGLLFSYATARSHHTSSLLTAGLHIKTPVIVNNGVFILENGTWKRLHGSYFSASDAARILSLLQSHDVHPLVYTYLGDIQKYSYVPHRLGHGTRNFIVNHPEDPRKRPVSPEQLLDGNIFYFTCIDEKEKLLSCYEQLKDDFHCVSQVDLYDGEQWLEIMPKNATKASAAIKLKEMLGCDKIISFGDGVNDLSLFSVSDECYAMENADERVKQAATAVIGSNEKDGVARFLLNYFK